MQQVVKSYVPEEFTKTFLINQAQDININSIEYFENATICVDKVRTTSCVYDINGNLCTASITNRYDGHETMPPFVARDNFIDEHVIFMGGGYVFRHFGHFLLEGLSRTYPLIDKKFKHKKLVFVVNKKIKKLPSYVLDMLSGLGVTQKDIILIHKTTMFAGVFVPPQSSVIGKYISNTMIKVLNTISNNLENRRLQTYDKIYLSRSKMNDGRTFGESGIEKIFANNGYKIIWPETLPLCDQITLAHNCRVMAGTAGTALHLAMFMKPGGTVIQIKRNTLVGDNAQNQYNICNLNKLNFIYIAGSIEKRPTAHFTDVPQIVGVTPYLKEFFDDNKFKYTLDDICRDKTSWKLYEKQLRKYKIKQCYNKVMKVIIRIISLVGITKYGRQIIREQLTHMVQI